MCGLLFRHGTGNALFSRAQGFKDVYWRCRLRHYSQRTVKNGCIKNSLLFSKLKDAPNPTTAGCSICTKMVGFDVWNLLCLHCDMFFCKACVDAGRFAHRHPANWCRVVKKVTKLFVSGMDVNCDNCSANYYGNSFTGLRCVSCNNYDYCFTPCVKGGKLPKEHAYCEGKLSSWELRIFA